MFSRSSSLLNCRAAASHAARFTAPAPIRRGYAAAAGTLSPSSSSSSSYEFETAEAHGVKYANRKTLLPTARLSVVARAGSRYQPASGLAEVLEKFAYKSTTKRTALRITRESELFGGSVFAHHTREHMILTTKFLSGDLPYYAELLAEVLANTRYHPYELAEEVLPRVELSQGLHSSSAIAQALDGAHSVAFHGGLGAPLIPSAAGPWKKNISPETVSSFAHNAYTKSGLALVSDGNDSANLAKWIGEFFPNVPTAPLATSAPSNASTNYFGGEQRIPSTAGNAIVVGFPGSSALGTAGFKPEYAVLAELLGGQSHVKWSNGSSLLAKEVALIPGASASSQNNAYSDTGLFTVTLSGSTVGVRKAAYAAAETLRKVAGGQAAAEDVKKAVALAKFGAIEHAGDELIGTQLLSGKGAVKFADIAKAFDGVTEAQVKKAAAGFLSGKASFAAVGDVDALPFASDVGLTV